MAQSVGYTASQVPGQLLNLERYWKKTRADQNGTYPAITPLLEGVWREQTADFAGQLTENDGCQKIKVSWMETSDHTVEEFTDQVPAAKTGVTCDIDGPVSASTSQEYEMNSYMRATLKVKERDCGNLFTQDDRFQQAQQSKIIDLINRLGKRTAQFMAASAGVSLTPGKRGSYEGGATKFADATAAQRKLLHLPEANFNGLFLPAWIAELSEVNRLGRPAIFDGGNLRYPVAQAGFQQGTNAGDIGAQNGFNQLRATYVDGLTMTDAGLADSTFIVQNGALALFTAAFFPTTPYDDEGNGFKRTKYRTPVPGLTQANNRAIELDTTFVKESLPITPGSTQCENWLIYEYRLWWLPLLNPMLSVNDGVTGVIRAKADA